MKRLTLQPSKYFIELCLLLALLCFAALVRFPYIFSAESLWSDEALYAWSGQQIFQNPLKIFSHEIAEGHSPLFPIILSVGHLIFPSELAYRFVMFVFYLFGIVAIFIFGKQLKNFYVGFLAASMLLANYYYFSYSIRILTDIPFLSFYFIYFTALLRIAPASPWSDHCKVGLLGSLAIWMRWPGVVLIPLSAFYYISRDIPVKQRLRDMFTAVGIMIFLTGWPCISKFFAYSRTMHASLLSAPALTITDNLKAFSSFYWDMFDVKWTIVLVIFGCYVIRKEEAPKKILVYLSVAISVLSLGFMGEHDSRYVFPLLSISLVVAAIGFEKILGVMFKSSLGKGFAGGLIVLLYLFTLVEIKSYLFDSRDTFTGYREAGNVIRQIGQDASLILTGSERQIRYTSGINFVKFGGKISELRGAKDDLIKLLSNIPGPVVLEIDRWESLQPVWVLDESMPSFLSQQGFRLIHTVVRPVSRREKAAKLPVISIFRKE